MRLTAPLLFSLAVQVAHVSATPVKATNRKAPSGKSIVDADNHYFDDAKHQCALPFNSGKTDVTKAVWDASKAKSYLKKFLDKHGVKNWANKLFISMLPEKQGGATYDCTNFPTDGKCNLPGFNLCKDYNPPEAFFIHTSIANFYSSFVKIHESMQDQAITLLASDIKEIIEDFGPDDGVDVDAYIWALIIGALVFAAPLSITFNAALTMGVGAANLAAGGANSQESGVTKLKANNQLETDLGKMYGAWSDQLTSAIKAVIQGDMEDTPNWANSPEKDPKKFIEKLFESGIWTDFTLVNPMVDDWIKAWKKLVKQGFVIRGLGASEKYIYISSIDKEECADRDVAYWISSRNACAWFAETQSSGFQSATPKPLVDETKLMKDKYDMDPEKFLANAIECRWKKGGDPNWKIMPDMDKPNLPECLANIDIKFTNHLGYLNRWEGNPIPPTVIQGPTIPVG